MAAPRVVAALQRILRDGPVSVAELNQQLERHGIRNLGSSDVWLACSEHGLADLVEGRWVPRGWAPPADAEFATTTSGVPRRTARVRPRDTDSLSALDRLEIDRLRALVRLDAAPGDGVQTVASRWPAIAQDAITALGDELTAVSRQRTQTDVTLRDGHVVARGESRVVMRFEADSDVVGRDGMSATLIADGAGFEVEVISLFGSVVTVALSHAAPNPRTAKLRCDLSWLLAAQSRRLRELAQGAPGFDSQAALDVIEAREPAERAGITAEVHGRLNAAQNLAVEHGLRDGVTWLWGPPGTGKTATLSVLISELMEGGARVLPAAPTNTALDIALRGVLAELGPFDEGTVVRLGQPVDVTLVDRAGGRVLVEEVADGRGEPIARRRMQVADTVRRLRAELGRLEKTTDDASVSDGVALQLAEATALAQALDGLMADVRRQVCRDARLVAATAHQLVLPTLSGASFDVVAIDEASMLPAALSMIVAGAGHGHTIVAGDFRQLPPVVIADSGPAHRWLRYSAFESSRIAGRVTRHDPPVNLVALTEQYRMPDDLTQALSDGFYPENRLHTADSVRRRPRTLRSTLNASIVCVDTSALRTRVARRNGTASRYNLMHVLIIGALVDDRTEIGDRPALITPFAPQARLLEALVGQDGQHGLASTVHRFQGGETEVVVFDAVDAARGIPRLHPWFEDGSDGTDGARLVDVAVSRARERLVIVADLSRIYRGRAHQDAIGRFFRSALERAHLLNPRDAVPTDSLQSRTDLARLAEDIAAARSTIEIWSKRVAEASIEALSSSIVDAADRGCRVSIWYEPASDGDIPRGLGPLAATSVLLRPCLPVRESQAVLDDVVWASSDSLLGPAPGHSLRRGDATLAEAVLRITRRREFPDVPGTGQPVARCRCGRLLVRDEAWGTRSICLHCDDRFSARHR